MRRVVAPFTVPTASITAGSCLLPPTQQVAAATLLVLHNDSTAYGSPHRWFCQANRMDLGPHKADGTTRKGGGEGASDDEWAQLINQMGMGEPLGRRSEKANTPRPSGSAAEDGPPSIPPTASTGSGGTSTHRPRDGPLGAMVRESAPFVHHLPMETAAADEPTTGSQGHAPRDDQSGYEVTLHPGERLAAARALGTEAKDLLMKELRKDREEKSTAAPMVPVGWAYHHQPGSRYVYLKRQVRSEFLCQLGEEAVRNTMRTGDNHPLDPTVRLPPQGSPLLSTKQRREVRRTHERKLLLAKLAAQQDRQKAKEFQTLMALEETAGAGEDLLGGRGRAQEARTGERGGQTELPLLDVTVQIPFQTIDPSFHDSTVDLAEHVSFDVRVTKPKAQHDTCLFMRLASVDSQLRIRSIQILPHRPTATTGSASDCGTAGTLTQKSHSQGTALVGGGCGKHQRAHPLDGEDDGIGPTSAAASAATGDGVGTRASVVATILSSPCSSWREEARYVRERERYKGPYARDLSPTLGKFFYEWLVTAVGLNTHMLEYICQAGYYAEHGEYLAWLARLDSFASAVAEGAERLPPPPTPPTV